MSGTPSWIRNTAAFVERSGTDLSRDDVLIVGCSMEELRFFAPRSRRTTCLDIGPRLAADCRQADPSEWDPGRLGCAETGECLPFEDESFDTVIVRQSLHHMLRYFSAICEFLRGSAGAAGAYSSLTSRSVLPAPRTWSSLSGADAEALFDSVRLGDVRSRLGLARWAAPGRKATVSTCRASSGTSPTLRLTPPIRSRSWPTGTIPSFPPLLGCIAAVRQPYVFLQF